MLRTCVVSIVALACLVIASACSAQEELRPGRLSSEERQSLLPGLQVEYQSLQHPDAPADVGTARMAALHVAEGQGATPFIPAGKFRAAMAGYVKLRLRGDYDFSLAGQGGAKLFLNDQLVLEASGDDLSQNKPVHVELVKGYNKLRLEYESLAAGDGAVRLYWSSDEFPAEPIFPQQLMHDGRDAMWQASQTVRQGRLLFAQNHCIKCHAPSDTLAAELARGGAMPEVARDAPSLIASGQRLNADWIAQWLLRPGAVRNHTTMPRVLAHLDEAAQGQHAADLAAYLSQQTDKAYQPIAPANGEDAIDAGETLFEERGCIACHRFSDVDDEEDEYDRVSLHYVDAKYQAGALASFIKDSRHYYSWSRMPKFDLTEGEAAALAGYLRKRSEGTLTPLAASPKADPQRGAKLFTTVGCANCHSVKQDGSLSGEPSKTLAEMNLTKGCLEADRNGSPRFPFGDAKRQAVAAFVKSHLPSLAHETPAEFSRRQFDVIGCNACHGRDDEDAELPYVLLDYSELGHPAEPIPNLTWAGEKLRADWAAKLLLGEIPYRPRPHFKIRMPAFPQRGKLLAAGFSAEHGFAPNEDARPKHDAELAKTGEKVAAMHTGLACHRCHAIGDKQATAPFEARSTNLSYATERLRHGFYHRWMHDPLRIDPETKMIKFAQDGKKTGLTDFYEGDARKQFEAVWHYLQMLNDQQQPSDRTAVEDRK